MTDTPTNPEARNKAEAPSQHDRMIYLGERIKELRTELKALREEGRKLRDSLRSLSDRKTPEAKALKKRLAYVTVRPLEAKAEFQRLTAERQQLKGAATSN